MQKGMNLLFPQWQGGGPDRSTYYGALELKENYLKDVGLTVNGVSTADVTAVKHDIYGLDEILKQSAALRKLLETAKPTRIFTIGGGCDAGIIPLSYLNSRAGSNPAVLWFDAHGDINSPRSSGSKHFYGMPVRALLGECAPEILSLLFSRLTPGQLKMIGVRDLDPPEKNYIKKNNIALYSPEEVETGGSAIVQALKTEGFRQVYIHLDLDVVDPTEFPHVPVPVPGGLNKDSLTALLKKIAREFELLGLGLFEYSPSGKKSIGLLEDIIRIGLNLTA